MACPPLPLVCSNGHYFRRARDTRDATRQRPKPTQEPRRIQSTGPGSLRLRSPARWLGGACGAPGPLRALRFRCRRACACAKRGRAIGYSARKYRGAWYQRNATLERHRVLGSCANGRTCFLLRGGARSDRWQRAKPNVLRRATARTRFGGHDCGGLEGHGWAGCVAAARALSRQLISLLFQYQCTCFLCVIKEGACGAKGAHAPRVGARAAAPLRTAAGPGGGNNWHQLRGWTAVMRARACAILGGPRKAGARASRPPQGAAQRRAGMASGRCARGTSPPGSSRRSKMPPVTLDAGRWSPGPRVRVR